MIRARSHRLALEMLESRTVPAGQLTATLDLTHNLLRIEGTDENDLIFLRHANGRLSLDGTPILVIDGDIVGTFDSVPDEQVASVVIDALDGGDAIEIEGLAAGTALTINAGAGSDVAWVYDASGGRAVSFDGGGTSSTDYLYFYDLRTGPNAYTITDTSINATGLPLSYTRLTSLILLSVNSSPDTFDVLSTAPDSNLHLWSYWGDDHFRVGGPTGLDAIRGDVFVWGMDGTNTLTVDNTGGSAARIEIGETQTTLPTGAKLDYSSGIESMSLRGGAANETFVLVNPPTDVVPGGVDVPIRTSIPFTMDGGGGSNTLEYAEAAGLVAWYEGELNAVDSAGEHTGFLFNGAATAEGAVGRALQFDGIDDYVQIPNAPGLESPTISVEAWVSATAPGTNRYIISKGGDAYRAASYGLYTGPTGGLQFYIADASTYVASPDAGAGLWDGNWHHVVGTFDGQFLRLFVDGAEVGLGTYTTTRIDYTMGQTQDLFLGNYGFGAGFAPQFAFNGRIDEASVYDRALTTTQVQSLYFRGKTGIGTAPVEVNLTAGTATGLTGIANIQNVTGGRGADTITGNAAANVLNGGAGDDNLSGVNGDDVLNGGAGSDFLFGGANSDTYVFGGAGVIELDRVAERPAPGTDTLDFSRLPLLAGPVTVDLTGSSILAVHLHRWVALAPLSGVSALQFEAAVGGPSADTMISHSAGARLDGGPGNDVITGGAGPDTLLGGLGNDTIDGAGGDDLLRGGRGDDLIRGGAGNDRIYGGDGNDRLEGQDNDDRLFGGDPDDFLILGIDGNDTLLGGNGGDVLKGGFGHDRLEGGSGFDTYDGGDGNDYLFEQFPDSANRLDGGDGDDYLETSIGASDAPQTLNGGAGNDIIYGNNGPDDINGGDGDDLIVAGAGDDSVLGGSGNDRIFGGLQGAGRINRTDNDYLSGGAGDDFIDGGHNDGLFANGEYRDSIYGGPGNDILYGGNGIDILTGGSGNDVMYGKDGDDTMYGNSGDDILYPGRGNDFVYAAPGNDVIRDVTEITSLSTHTGTTAEALNPGSLVAIYGDGLPVNAAVQFGGANKQTSASARATEVSVAPDRKSITVRLPRGASSGTLWVIDTQGTADVDDDTWMDAPGRFEVRTFRNTQGFSFANFGFQVSLPIVQEAFGTIQTNITFPNPSPVGPSTIITPVPTPQALLFTAISALAFNDKGSCFGMALMSRHLVNHPEWLTTELGLPFGSAPTAWNLTANGDLFAQIERTHQHQLSQEVINHTIAWKAADLAGLHTKTSIYNEIRNLLLAGDRPLLSFQNDIAEGHVVVAYDLEWATSNQNPDAGFFIHVYDPNRPQMASDSPNTNGMNLANSRIYIGSEGLVPGEEWQFNMASKGLWAGGFGDFMIIPYSTLPVGRAPTFPGTLPSLSDLILGTQVAPAATGDTGAPSVVQSIPTVSNASEVFDSATLTAGADVGMADRSVQLWLAPAVDPARAPAPVSAPELDDRPGVPESVEETEPVAAPVFVASTPMAREGASASADDDGPNWLEELDQAHLALWVD